MVYDEEEQAMEYLRPIGHSDDDSDQEYQHKKETEVEVKMNVAKETASPKEELIEANYVFRVAIQNDTRDNFLVDLMVKGRENSHFCGRFNIIVKGEKKEYVVCNLHSLNLENQFENLQIFARVHRYQNVLDKKFHDFEGEEYKLLYTHSVGEK